MIVFVSEQTKCAVSCTSVTQAKLRVFPVFAKEVFYEVLSELSIEIHQSSFEADEVGGYKYYDPCILINYISGDSQYCNTGELSCYQQ